MRFVKREISESVLKMAQGFPVVVMTGPRQSGKTTLAKALFADRPYVNLETPTEREFAVEDPLGFLARFPDGAVLDEVQNAPELLSYVQSAVDEDGRMGLFVLTGSQHFGLSERISQSLAGRAAITELLPFSYRELVKHGLAGESLEACMIKGAYPPVHDRGLDAPVWYRSYVRTYIERDVRSLVNVHDLAAFREFMSMAAAYVAQEINYAKMATACGVSANTIKSWLGILEASYVIRVLRPYYNSFRKRTAKTPKLYFLDTGLVCYLRKVRSPEQLSDATLKGQLFENWAISELVKLRLNRCAEDNLYFWRQQEGLEVDVVIDHGTSIEPVEIKAGATPKVDFAMRLRRFADWAGDRAADPKVIYAGNETLTIKGVHYLPWQDYFALDSGKT